ncbi:serine/threonine protein kinase [Diaporthe helianthi]|uniref:non-specific serine/threonine protein kinase n=1 Tax=Diaporthe helianthi TaxID=158607 RepID=A0A2P5I199_DIAHE|nr:serine/threonine protein kinase [Diaporthe helianthi]
MTSYQTGTEGAAPATYTEQQSDIGVTGPGETAVTEQRSGVTVTESSDIEEGRDAYQPGGFHPVYIGDIYADKYEVMSKIGYGRYSTVWLVKDLSKPPNDEHQFRALKVLSADCYGQDNPIFEKEILTHLGDGNRKLMGYKYICHLVDDFELEGPNGSHVCLVLELMGETLLSFGVWFKEFMVPTTIMRKFSLQLVAALDFAHESGVIHTDIKPDNIFVKVRDVHRIETEYLVEEPIPQQNKDEEQYTPIRSRSLRKCYFGDDPTRLIELDVALGDWGVSSWADKHLTENIQPVALRAPEVLIRAPWDTNVDWWNLGAVIFEVYRSICMFDGGAPPDGHYEVREHLAEIVDLFGPFPKRLLEKGDAAIREWFDDGGRIKDYEPMGRPPLESETFLPGLDQTTRDVFGSFLRAMMKIDPGERPIPGELVQQPWLDPKCRW